MIDVRSNTATPLEQSEDQEDELLSIVSIKGYVRLSGCLPVALLTHNLRIAAVRNTSLARSWVW